MKLTFLQISILEKFPQLVKDPTFSLNMIFSFIFNIDKNIIQIYNNNNIKLFHVDLIDIALEICQSIGQLKKYYMIFKMVVSSLESCFLLIFFANFYLLISICKVKWVKLLRLPQFVEKLSS